MHAAPSVQSLFPPTGDTTRPEQRIPSMKSPEPPAPGMPTPCGIKPSNHDYINAPSLSSSSGKRYENVADTLKDPAVQRARDKYIADTGTAATAAGDEPSYINLRESAALREGH